MRSTQCQINNLARLWIQSSHTFLLFGIKSEEQWSCRCAPFKLLRKTTHRAKVQFDFRLVDTKTAAQVSFLSFTEHCLIWPENRKQCHGVKELFPGRYFCAVVLCDLSAQVGPRNLNQKFFEQRASFCWKRKSQFSKVAKGKCGQGLSVVSIRFWDTVVPA